jgi:hypothetical protein
MAYETIKPRTDEIMHPATGQKLSEALAGGLGGGSGIEKSTTAPTDTNKYWLDISGGAGKGVFKYYDGTGWVPITGKAVWG